MSIRIKRLKNPTFSEAEYLSIDPVAFRGEIMLVRDPLTFKVINFKLGDGVSKFSELSYQNSSVYPFSDLVTNEIGDLVLGSSHLDRLIPDMIKDMISPYQDSVVSNVRTNAAGASQVTSQLEVGQSITTAIAVTYDVSNQANLVPDPMELNSFGFFDESNPYPLGAISIAPLSPIAPTQPQIYTINVRANHTGGVSSWKSAFIRFDMRFLWGASQLADLTTTQHALDLINNGGGQAVKQNWQSEYEITTGGYGYVLIPSLLLNSVPAPVFTEVSDPNAPASIGMVNMGTLAVNNGVATYNYEKFRTPFLNTGGVKLKAS